MFVNSAQKEGSRATKRRMWSHVGTSGQSAAAVMICKARQLTVGGDSMVVASSWGSRSGNTERGGDDGSHVCKGMW